MTGNERQGAYQRKFPYTVSHKDTVSHKNGLTIPVSKRP